MWLEHELRAGLKPPHTSNAENDKLITTGKLASNQTTEADMSDTRARARQGSNEDTLSLMPAPENVRTRRCRGSGLRT
ncbi:hypothetical protein R1flu_024658 [Riccia fluitans]|uniref:Uncharacterized protein n=1 Tax=Riccia fluitans TaxID=41844 RepID=A0ABD1XVI8_9MARC